MIKGIFRLIQSKDSKLIIKGVWQGYLCVHRIFYMWTCVPAYTKGETGQGPESKQAKKQERVTV